MKKFSLDFCCKVIVKPCKIEEESHIIEIYGYMFLEDQSLYASIDVDVSIF